MCVCVYIKFKMNNLEVISILNKLELICLHTVKWFQVLLSNSYNFISYESFVCIQLNGFKYCYLTRIILSYINCFSVHC